MDKTFSKVNRCVLICAIVQDDSLALVVSHDFVKRTIGIRREFTNGRIISEQSLLMHFKYYA